MFQSHLYHCSKIFWNMDHEHHHHSTFAAPHVALLGCLWHFPTGACLATALPSGKRNLRPPGQPVTRFSEKKKRMALKNPPTCWKWHENDGDIPTGDVQWQIHEKSLFAITDVPVATMGERVKRGETFRFRGCRFGGGFRAEKTHIEFMGIAICALFRYNYYNSNTSESFLLEKNWHIALICSTVAPWHCGCGCGWKPEGL